MPLEDARAILVAEYRPPIKRGDLNDIPPGALVGVIDGVFQQFASVSPREVHRAAERGVLLYGASSMGALRALEVSGMIGVGRVYEMYRDGLIVSDDEVALALDPDSGRPLTVPLVNVRFAVQRLQRSGTLTAALAERIVQAAEVLHFTERTYTTILDQAGLLQRADAHDLVRMLDRFDLKREDAHTLLERLAHVQASGWQPPSALASSSAGADSDGRAAPDYGDADDFAEVQAASEFSADAPVLIWETGDRVEFADLVWFLQMTGTFETYGRNALARYAMEGNEFDDVVVAERAAQDLFSHVTRVWGWTTSPEIHVTTRDLGLGLEDLGERCGEEAAARAVTQSVAYGGSDEFLNALRAELFLNDLALKRESLRLASLQFLADIGRRTGPLSARELAEARGKVGALHWRKWEYLPDWFGERGIERVALERFVETLGLARRAARDARRQTPESTSQSPASNGEAARISLRPSPKADGDLRYCTPMADALAATTQLCEVIGVTRVGMVGELGRQGIHISQAARPTGSWSSTYGSGKGESREGAMVGGVMEEVEKWAQEQFRPSGSELTVASYRELGERAVDPATLELPHDTRYRPDLSLQWYPVWDLLQAREFLVPLAVLVQPRCKNDIMFSQRGSRRLVSTNGLASGFTLEEALNHGMCEVIERHATRLDEIATSNPGGRSMYGRGRFLDPARYPGSLARLVEDLEADGTRQTLFKDITGALGVPVMAANLFTPDMWCTGWGAHPNPEVAAKMALFEAVQSWVSTIAGGREDLSITARSLGRHERPRPRRFLPFVVYQDPDKPLVDIRSVGGLRADDVRDEVLWVVDKLRAHGIRHVLALDLSRPDIAPARVCRVIIPGLETNNPFYIGPEGRMALIRDLLPR